jgi:hypothetical protein
VLLDGRLDRVSRARPSLGSVGTTEIARVDGQLASEVLIDLPGYPDGVEGTVHHLEVGHYADRRHNGLRPKHRFKVANGVADPGFVATDESGGNRPQDAAVADIQLDVCVDDPSQVCGGALSTGALTEHTCMCEQSIEAVVEVRRPGSQNFNL